MSLNIQILEHGAEQVRSRLPEARPRCGIILGSGWGDAVRTFESHVEIPFTDISCLGAPQVGGHAGNLIQASYESTELLLFQGRRHWYEGAGWEPVAFPVYLCAALGCRDLILTNAAGGLHAEYSPGDLMLIEDHINAMGVNPLIGPHIPVWGPRFPEMSAVYNPGLKSILDSAAKEAGVILRHGVYAAVSGPNYETPAEVRALRQTGADAVGMSTVPEAILGHAAGLRVAGLSCIANHAAGVRQSVLSHHDVVATIQRTLPTIGNLLQECVKQLSFAS